MSRKKLVITGANGYIASLVALYNADRFDIVPVTRADVDLSDPDAVRAYFSALDFDLLFHTAAVATTALCENEPEMMWLTTMSPDTRRLIKVMPEDVEKTAYMFDLLLGDDLTGRKNHIADHGHEFLELADIS